MKLPHRADLAIVTILMLPALSIVALLLSGEPWRAGIRPSGDVGAKLLVATLCFGPLARLFPGRHWADWLVRRRRTFGLMAFSYAVLHLAIFCASIGRLEWIVQGMAFASMWTGWIAFALLLLIATISNSAAMVTLGPWWKRLQRLVYAAALLTLAHWLLLSRSFIEALLHLLPVASLWIWIAANQLFSHVSGRIVRTR